MSWRVIGLISAVVAGAVPVFFVLRKRSSKHSCISTVAVTPVPETKLDAEPGKTKEVELQTGPGMQILPPAAPEPNSELPFPDQIEALVASLADEDLAGLLRSRMEDLEFEETDAAKAGSLVSVLDEIRIMEPGIKGADQGALTRVAAAMRYELDRMDARVLDLDEWDPQWQRAIEVRRNLPPGSIPVIAEKVESGLVFRGRLLRKQSVILLKAME